MLFLSNSSLKSVEISFESYPQLILGTFIVIGLQIDNTLNYVSCVVSALSVVYGFAEVVVLFSHQKVQYPFVLTVLGALSTILDSLLRAFFMSYILSIIKAYALILPPIYFVLLFLFLTATKQYSFHEDGEVKVLCALLTFGSSAITSGEADEKYQFRMPSKIIFAVIFIPSLCLVTHFETASLHNIDNIDNMNNTTTSVNLTTSMNTTICEDLCIVDEATIVYCKTLWKHMGPQTKVFGLDVELPGNHLKIVIALSVLFILSSIEGLMDACFSWTPNNMLHNYEFAHSDNDNDSDLGL